MATYTDGYYSPSRGDLIRIDGTDEDDLFAPTFAESVWFFAGGGNDIINISLTTGNLDNSFAVEGSRFSGGAGNDRFIFHYLISPPHYIHGDEGIDTVEYSGRGPAFYMTEVMSDFVLHHRSGITVLTSIERFVISGSTHIDGLIGASGNDWLNGGGGIDTYKGSNGNDGYVFDRSEEFVSGPDAGIDTIWTTASQDLNRSAGVENLRLQSGDINGTGNALANTITGSAGNNVIAGSFGKDSLYGKGGADTFAFAEFGAANKDSIWDFGSDDKIQLSQATFLGLDKNGDGILDFDALSLTGKAVGEVAQLIYNKASGNLSYDADGAGGQAAQDIAFIGKKLTFLDHTDILIA